MEWSIKVHGRGIVMEVRHRVVFYHNRDVREILDQFCLRGVKGDIMQNNLKVAMLTKLTSG